MTRGPTVCCVCTRSRPGIVLAVYRNHIRQRLVCDDCAAMIANALEAEAERRGKKGAA